MTDEIDAQLGTLSQTWVFPPSAGELTPEASAEILESARVAKEKAEATRAFVLEHFTTLRGQMMPTEIMSIQNLPGHSCLIINDLLLLSYVEAEQFIKKLAGESDA